MGGTDPSGGTDTIRGAVANSLTIRSICTMLDHATIELFFDDLYVTAANLIVEEGHGFRYVLNGMNYELILIASECISHGTFFVDNAAAYARQRSVSGRPIGQSQGIQFPIARAHIGVSAVAELVKKTTSAFDAELSCGTDANMAKMLASEASWYAADMWLETHGGFGLAEEYDISRSFGRLGSSRPRDFDQPRFQSRRHFRAWTSEVVAMDENKKPTSPQTNYCALGYSLICARPAPMHGVDPPDTRRDCAGRRLTGALCWLAGITAFPIR